MIFLLARRVRSLDYDEIPNSMKKFVYKLKPYMNEDSSEEDDELNENEKKKVVDTHQYIEKSEESSSEQNKEEDNDNQTMLSRFMGDDRENILQNSDEN